MSVESLISNDERWKTSLAIQAPQTQQQRKNFSRSRLPGRINPLDDDKVQEEEETFALIDREAFEGADNSLKRTWLLDPELPFQ